MSPSRGAESTGSTAVVPAETDTDTDTKANTRSSSALRAARRNLHYLFAPGAPGAPRPAHLRTRALLRCVRYIGVFVFWRVVRYARYALAGSLAAAAVGASALGSGAAFVLAPPTLLAGVGVGAAWAVGRWGLRRMRRAGDGAGGAAAVEAGAEAEGGGRRGTSSDGGWRDVRGPGAAPW